MTFCLVSSTSLFMRKVFVKDSATDIGEMVDFS